MDAAELCEYIEKRHHTYVRETSAELLDHLKASVELEGVKHPELHRILAAFIKLKEELEQHFNREEKILFPLVRELRSDTKKRTEAGTDQKLLEKPLLKMNEEHKIIYSLLHELRELSADYKAPSSAAPMFKKSFSELHDLEDDLMRQFYLEENILNVKLLTP